MTSPTRVSRALAIAANRLGAEAALARVAGEDGAAAQALSRSEAASVVGELASVRPHNWRRIHPSWIEHALAGEGAAVRAAVRGDGEQPVERFLARWFLGGFVAMPDEGARGPAALAVLEANALTQALIVIGRRQLAHAIAAAPPRELAAMATRLPWGRELVTEVAAITARPDDAVARLGSRRSAIARTAGLVWTDRLSLPRAGLRAIAPACASIGDLPRQIAQRLPRPIGQVAAVELTGPFALAPADGVSAAEIAAAIARGSVGA